MTGRRGINRIAQRFGVGMLSAALTLGALGIAAPQAEAATITKPGDAGPQINAYPAMEQGKPQITIRGNGVIDKSGRATGFYELSLCVQTTFVYPVKTGTTEPDYDQPAVAWDTYSKELEDAKAVDDARGDGLATEVDTVNGKYAVVVHPFQNASAAVTVNVDALTAVSWSEALPEYSVWDKTNGYLDGTGAAVGTWSYPYGVDKDALSVYFDLTQAAPGDGHKDVRLDTAAPDEGVRAEAIVEDYDADKKTALITLSANTTENAPVNYTEPTEVVVIRFAYDKARFANSVTKTVSSTTGGVTTASEVQDFWVGPQKDDSREKVGGGDESLRTALTYFVDTEKLTAISDILDAVDAADEMVAEKTAAQWFAGIQVGLDEDNETFTKLYYYLGGDDIGSPYHHATDNDPTTPKETVTENGVIRYGYEDTPVSVTTNSLRTEGTKVLAWKTDATATTTGGNAYSYEWNLLKRADDSFRMEYVNQETYRPATGGKGGIQILFYDWDDSLIGAMIVDETGDARADVEQYVEKNMVHPDLRPDAAAFKTDANAAANLESMLDGTTREFSYRGKYSYIVGGNDAVYGVSDGEYYPLTNKLDYVFYRRVNGVTHVSRTTMGSTTETDYYSTQKLSQFEDGKKYPYTYGWALVAAENFTPSDSGKVRQDAAKIEDTWTTFGSGELSNYNSSSTGGTLVGVTTGATAVDAIRYPSWVDLTAVGGDPDEDGTGTVAAPTNYRYALSDSDDNGYLEFADFSKMEDLVTRKDGTTRDTIIVKAVYEQGESIEKLYYTMVSSPQYSKLNNVSAASGGAYTVDVTLERFNYTEAGERVGVYRVRSPMVRQHGTTDLHWEETVGEDGTRQELTNATQNEADVTRNKTVYTKVDQENGEEIEVQLVLSGRTNKVDFYLIETYESNFVVGGEQSDGNAERKEGGIPTEEYIVDNYNYFVDGESDTTDNHFDVVDYDDRDGSYGFVLFGTLNKMMEEAYNYSASSSTNFLNATAEDVLADANLRMDSSGKKPSTSSQLSAVRTKIRAAAAAAAAHAGAADESDYWNSKKSCPELTYHQIQWYILEETLYSRVDAFNKKLSWCHLHQSCVDEVSGAPKTWDELVDAAKTDPSKIDKMMLDDVKNKYYLKFNENGSNFASIGDFKTKFVAAVTELNAAGTPITWENVQKAIIGNADLEPAKDFWWAADTTLTSKPSRINNFEALITAIKEKSEGVTLPDGNKMYPEVKLVPIDKLIADNKTAAGEKTDESYVSATENLVVSATTEADGSLTPAKFNGYDEFVNIVEAAYQQVKTEPVDSELWYKLQWAIIYGDTTSYTLTEAKEKFYWHNGKRNITDLTSMLEAAADSDTTRWDAFTSDKYHALNLYFNVAFNGASPVTNPTDGSEKNWTNFQDKIKAFVSWIESAANTTGRGITDMTWQDVQYWLLHGSYVDERTANREHDLKYYWWEGGGTAGEAQQLPAILPGEEPNMSQLVAAAFKSKINGNANAWNARTGSDMQDYLNGLYLKNVANYSDVNSSWAYEDVPTFSSDADVETFKTALENLVQLAVNDAVASGSGDEAHTAPTLTWYQIQHYFITREYKADSEIDKDALWWYGKNDGPDHADAGPTPFDTFRDGIMQDPWSMTDADLNAMGSGDLCFINEMGDFISAVDHDDNGGSVLTQIDMLLSEGYNMEGLTWYHIQYYLLNWMHDDDAETAIKDQIIAGGYDWRPQWLKDADPIEMSVSLFQEEEIVDDGWLELLMMLKNLTKEQQQQVLEMILRMQMSASPDAEAEQTAEPTESEATTEETPEEPVLNPAEWSQIQEEEKRETPVGEMSLGEELPEFDFELEEAPEQELEEAQETSSTTILCQATKKYSANTAKKSISAKTEKRTVENTNFSILHIRKSGILEAQPPRKIVRFDPIDPKELKSKDKECAA